MSVLRQERIGFAPQSFVLAAILLMPAPASAQLTPPSPERPWHTSTPPKLEHLQGRLRKELELSPTLVYCLPQLIDLAEQHNPDTRAAWQEAKVQAGLLGVAKADIFPTLAATAMGQTSQDGVLLYSTFVAQILGITREELSLNYTLLDFGARIDRIARQRRNVLAANFGFNDVHRRVIYQVMMFYYQLLNANGQRKAAEANLQNAKAVEQAAEARLLHGLATLPDVLEARSATAQAEYDLQQTIGAEETASGDLATTLMASPAFSIHIEAMDGLHVPDALPSPVEELMRRALKQRPDLQARLADIQAAQASIHEAKTAFLPALGFQGTWGHLRAYGEQPPYPAAYAGAYVYNAQLNLSWTIFDGGRRRSALAQAKAQEKEAQARAESTQDQIADEVWRSYSDTKTALRQRDSAHALLDASTVSYNAALEAYNYGVRSILDVLSAQRSLAQARSADISARAQVLTSFADLGYRTGDLLEQQARKPKP